MDQAYNPAKLIKAYFIFLFIALAWLYWPSFFYPPRSDNWAALYNFFRIDTLAQTGRWKYLMMYDPLINATFRPLSFLIPYFEHNIFGPNFVYAHLINFGLYFSSIILLYKLAGYFCKDKILTLAFLTVYAFLFSHFDIVAWEFHAHIILGFCLFLAGFIFYFHYLKIRQKIFLYLIAGLFLSAMLLYEVYLLWPLAVIILTHLGEPHRNQEQKVNQRDFRPPLLILGVTYGIYFLVFLINSMERAAYGAGIALTFLFSVSSIIKTFFAVFANLMLNNFLLNLYPFWAFPLKIDENLNLGGLVDRFTFNMDNIIFFAGAAAVIVLFLAVLYLRQRRDYYLLKVFSLFFFLFFGELFILFWVKSLVNAYPYHFLQFRFQYVPNALFMLIVLIFSERLLKSSKIGKGVLMAVLIFVLALNIQATRQGVALLGNQLAPLQKMLMNIKTGIKTGQINKENKLFLDSRLALKFPVLCWNREMGRRCMRGTYQWVFSKDEIEYFAPYEAARWVIQETDLTVVPK